MFSIRSLRPAAAFPVLGLLALGTTSCEKDSHVSSVGVAFETPIELNAAGGAPLRGSYSSELDPDTYANLRDNREKMESMTIGDISYVVADARTEVMGTRPRVSGAWKFYPSDQPTEVTLIAAVNDADLLSLKAATTPTLLTITDDVRAKLVNLVKAKKKLMIVFEGTSTQPNYSRLRLTINAQLNVKN